LLSARDSLFLGAFDLFDRTSSFAEYFGVLALLILLIFLVSTSVLGIKRKVFRPI